MNTYNYSVPTMEIRNSFETDDVNTIILTLTFLNINIPIAIYNRNIYILLNLCTGFIEARSL